MRYHHLFIVSFSDEHDLVFACAKTLSRRHRDSQHKHNACDAVVHQSSPPTTTSPFTHTHLLELLAVCAQVWPELLLVRIQVTPRNAETDRHVVRNRPGACGVKIRVHGASIGWFCALVRR